MYFLQNEVILQKKSTFDLLKLNRYKRNQYGAK